MPMDEEIFNQEVARLLPTLHRYSARMVGTVFDAEDVVQDALTKAFSKLSETRVENFDAWVFRIVHTTSLDHLRKRNRLHDLAQEATNLESNEFVPALEEREIANFAFSLFLRLTPLQRSSVILKDVIGYSLQEISELLEVTIGAVKSALFRAREALRRLARADIAPPPPALDNKEADLLAQYVARFNARDFDALRSMLAEDVKLNLVTRIRVEGAAEVGRYFGNYDRQSDWHLSVGTLEGRPVVYIQDTQSTGTQPYVVLIQWDAGKVAAIRDYRYARHVLAGAPIEIP